MKPSPAHIDRLLDLVVDAVVREINGRNEDAAESGQEQRRRHDFEHGDNTPDQKTIVT